MMKKYISVLLFLALMLSIFSCKAEDPSSDVKTIANSDLQAKTSGSTEGNMLVGIGSITITDGNHVTTPVVVTAPTGHNSISINYLKSIVANTLFEEFNDEIASVSVSIELGSGEAPIQTATATATLTAQTGYVFEGGGTTKIITVALSTLAADGFVDTDVEIPNDNINITTDSIEATGTTQGIAVITITDGANVATPVEAFPITVSGVKTVNVDKLATIINYNIAQKYIVAKGLISNVEVTVVIGSASPKTEALATITLTAQEGHTFQNSGSTKIITVALEPAPPASGADNVFVDNTTILNSDINFRAEAVTATVDNIGITTISVSVGLGGMISPIDAIAYQKIGVSGIVNLNVAKALIKTQVNNADNFPVNVDKAATKVNLSYLTRIERDSPLPTAASGFIILNTKSGYKFQDGTTRKEFFMFLML